MIQLNELTQIVGESIFSGDTTLAGIAIFAVVIGMIFAWNKNAFTSLLLVMPIALIFTTLGVIGGDFMILMIIIAVLGLAVTAKGALTRSD